MRQQVLGTLVCILLIAAVIPAARASSSQRTEKAKASATSEFNISFWGGLGVQADIKNYGPPINVTWQLEVKGSILGLIHKSSSGVLVIQGGESRWVSTGPFLGIGPFTVTATANEVEKTAKGFVLFFYVIILD